MFFSRSCLPSFLDIQMQNDTWPRRGLHVAQANLRNSGKLEKNQDLYRPLIDHTYQQQQRNNHQ